MCTKCVCGLSISSIVGIVWFLFSPFKLNATAQHLPPRPSVAIVALNVDWLLDEDIECRLAA